MDVWKIPLKTPLKFNEWNSPRREIPFGNQHFSGSMLLFGGVFQYLTFWLFFLYIGWPSASFVKEKYNSKERSFQYIARREGVSKCERGREEAKWKEDWKEGGVDTVLLPPQNHGWHLCFCTKWNFISLKYPYGWWKKSCTSWYGKYPIIYRVFYIPGG